MRWVCVRIPRFCAEKTLELHHGCMQASGWPQLSPFFALAFPFRMHTITITYVKFISYNTMAMSASTKAVLGRPGITPSRRAGAAAPQPRCARLVVRFKEEEKRAAEDIKDAAANLKRAVSEWQGAAPGVTSCALSTAAAVAALHRGAGMPGMLAPGAGCCLGGAGHAMHMHLRCQ